MGFLALILVLAIAHVNGEGACSVKCSADTEEACDKLSNCRWNSGDSGSCNYPDVDPCPLTGTTCPESCVYHPSRAYCSRPYEIACIQYNQEATCRSSGCKWYPPQLGCFSDAGSCQDRSEGSCTAENGCFYQPTSSGFGNCGFDSNTDPCSRLESEGGCTNNPACSWESPQGECYMEDPNCYRIDDEPTCNTTDLCEWSDGYKECKSNTDLCRSLPPARCYEGPNCQLSPETYWCESENDLDTCEADETGTKCLETSSPGCSWKIVKKEHCDTSLHCDDNSEKTACDENSDAECVWEERYPGFCSFTGDASCASNPGNTDCTSEAKSAGCKWRTRAGYCNHKQCTNNNENTGCTPAALASGCTWNSPPGYCRALKDHGGDCYDNSQKANCDQESDQLCEWTDYSGRCRADEQLQCYSNSDNTACSTASSAVGCLWVEDPAYCNFEGYPCNDNAGKTACDSTSDDRCVWYPGAEASCESNSDASCSPNEDKTDCSDDSKAQGCEWNPDTGSIVRVPVSIMFFVLIAFALL